MTALNGPILFNSSTGSDTAASGLGPSTAVTGSGASTTSGSAVVTGIDTTGVTSGDLLWVSTSTGRQFSVVASVDSGTQVTCDDTFGVTAGSQTWAIGGKRLSLNNANSRKIFENGGSNGDGQVGYTVRMESGYTDTLTSNLRFRRPASTYTAALVLEGDPDAATKPILTANFNGTMFTLGGGNGFQLKNFDAINTNATKTASVFVTSGSGGTGSVIENVGVGNPTNYFYRGITWSVANLRIEGCVLDSCADYAISLSAGSAAIIRNTIKNNGSGCTETGTGIPNQYIGNIISDNSSHGISITNSGGTANGQGIVRDNIITGNTGDGLSLNGTIYARMLGNFNCRFNIFRDNGGWGINSTNATDGEIEFYGAIVDFNVFGFPSNTSGQTTGISNGPNDITLTVDPFVDAASGDFNINNTAGGGALLRAVTVTL